MESGRGFNHDDISIEEIVKMVNNMVGVLLPGQMEGSMKVCSREVNHMGREHTQI